MTTLKPYAQYEDSGIDWLPKVPAGWQVARCKSRVRLITDRAEEKSNPVALENIEGWTGRLIESDSEFAAEGVRFEAGDVLFGKLRPYLAKSWAADRAGEAVGDFYVMRPGTTVNPKFLNYMTLSPEFIYMVDGSTFGSKMPRVSWDFIANIRYPFPGIEVQNQIVSFLDRETAQIDKLIGKQERLIELLAEKRQAEVSDYIADMIQPSPRDPGMRLKHLYNVIDERANGADLPLMSVSIHRGLQRRDETTDDEPRADDLSNYKVCRRGDLVINRMRAFQGALGYSAESGLISPDYLVLRPHRTVDSGWLSAVLRSHWAIGQMRSRLRGIGSVEQGVVRTPRINASDLGEIRIRVPSATAQRSFLDHNQDVTERLDLLTNKAAAAVHLLRERRSTLISAAVTGKIDVREGVA